MGSEDPLFSWQIRELASDLLIRYFPPVFPESIAVALFECAQEGLSSPRVQEAEAGAVLMKTILQKYGLTKLSHLTQQKLSLGLGRVEQRS